MEYAVDLLPVDEKGFVTVQTLEACQREDTMLVSVMMANNEIGTIESIRELCKIAHRRGCLFHTDAVQTVGHIPIDVKTLDIDLLSASAHKFNGPKGIGFLYIREGVTIESFLHGGAQENGQRAGTENVAGIVGMATALNDHCDRLAEEEAYLRQLSETLLRVLHGSGLDFIVNGSDRRIPGSLSVSFKNVDGEMLMHRLDLMGTAVATGSACNSKETELSHVIQAIRVPKEYAHGTIRITLRMDNTEDQMYEIAGQICRIIDSP